MTDQPFPTPPEGGQPYQPPQYGAPQYPGPAQPPYGQPYGTPYAPGVAGPKRNGMGVAALVLGILAILTGWFVLGGVLGILAVVFGVIGRGRAKRGEADNGGLALAGLICGAIGIVIAAGIIVAGVFVLNSDSGKRYQDCIRTASTQAEIDDCANRFRDDLTN